MRTRHRAVLLRSSAVGVLLLLISVLSGCASIPEPLRDEIDPREPLPRDVVAEPDHYIGSVVRWGGRVVAVTHQAESTTLEMVARPLDRDARPLESAPAVGRFLAVMPGFVEPLDVDGERQVTVTGVVDAVVTGRIGDHDYQYPRVQVSGLHRWTPLPSIPPGAWTDPWWHSPWYGPWHRPFFAPPLRVD